MPPKRKSPNSNDESVASSVTKAEGDGSKKPKLTNGNNKGKSSDKGANTGMRSRAWTDDRDEVLRELFNKYKPKSMQEWKPLREDFLERFPDDDDRTILSMTIRWGRIKADAGLEGLDEKKKTLFKKSVEDIKRNKISNIELIAMRYSFLGNEKITKYGVSRLLKAMEKWTLNCDDATNSQDEDNDEKSAAEVSENGVKNSVGKGKKKTASAQEGKKAVNESKKAHRIKQKEELKGKKEEQVKKESANENEKGLNNKEVEEKNDKDTETKIFKKGDVKQEESDKEDRMVKDEEHDDSY